MTLAEVFARDEVFIDFDSGIRFAVAEVYADSPCRLPAVEFQLVGTAGLEKIADRIRKDEGYRPLHPLDEYTEGDCDRDGTYDFFIGLNVFWKGHLEQHICFRVENTESEDDGELYFIELTPLERDAVYGSLDRQCRETLGKSCEDLLEDAWKHMEQELREQELFGQEESGSTDEEGEDACGSDPNNYQA